MAKLRKMLGHVDEPAVEGLMRLIETQSKETLGRWAARYVRENYLPVFEKYGGSDHRLEKGLEAADQCANGTLTVKEAKVYWKEAGQAARELSEDPVIQAAARAISTACAVMQTPGNALGFAFYGAAVSAYSKSGLKETEEVYDRLATEELERILESLKAAAVEGEEKPVKVKWNC